MTLQNNGDNDQKIAFYSNIIRTVALGVLGWLAISMIGVKEDIASLKASVQILLSK